MPEQSSCYLLHCCPVKCPAPSRRSSIGGACRLILFGADLNFVRLKPRTFPGLTTAPGNTDVRRQNTVRPSHAVRAVDELYSHRCALQGRRRHSYAVLRRAVSCDGLRATDLAREPARHPGQSGRQPHQALCDGLSVLRQALHACRCQRVARLAHLVRLGHPADPTRTQAARERLARSRFGQHDLRIGLQHHRSDLAPENCSS